MDRLFDLPVYRTHQWIFNCYAVINNSDEATLIDVGLPSLGDAAIDGLAKVGVDPLQRVPSAYLAKQMQALSRAGIVESVPGRNGGYKLARPAADITLLDVVLALEGPERAFRCTEIRQQGPSAVSPSSYVKPCGIASAMWKAEETYRQSLAVTTIADLVAELETGVDPEQTEKAIVWLAKQLGL